MHRGKTIGCVINPWAGREKEIIISPAKEPKTVLVVGGGPSGLEVARILSERGHKVTLAEKMSVFGGALRSAMQAPVFQDQDLQPSMIERFIDYQVLAAKAAGAELHSLASLDNALIDRVKPDVIVLTTGASYRFPLSLIIPFLLRTGIIRIALFKKMSIAIHDSPRFQNMFFKTFRKRNLQPLAMAKKRGLKVYTVGDCDKPGRTQEALLSAASIGADV
jgi:hypothetical protein